MQVRPATSSAFLRGQALVARPLSAARPRLCVSTAIRAAAQQQEERLRLNNLSPQDGARRKNLRKGRGYGAGQGGSCGFGMRGQKSRSGSGTRPGFEGGQMPLYRRLPKLKGIAGGMHAGVPDFVVINLDDLTKFADGEEVSLASLAAKRVLNVSGREAKLPLKVLGNGELSLPLTIHAACFSASAKAKIEAAGGKAVEVPQKPKWTRKAHEAALAAAGTPWTKKK